MSAISEINKVWIQKFPGSSLPAAWEEDVKTNLAKHKQRVQELQDELEQERVYVQFLESLLIEVEKIKQDPSSGPPPIVSSLSNGNSHNNMNSHTKDMDDVIKDTLERRTGQFQSTSIDASTDPIASEEDIPISTTNTPNPEPETLGTISEPEIETIQEGLAIPQGGELSSLSTTEESTNNKDHFVTVIEVNGDRKSQAGIGPTELSSPSSSQEDSSKGATDDVKRLKKIPPRPPPKSIRRPGSDVNDENRQSTSALTPETENPDRPIVFDSRKTSSSTTNFGSSFRSNYEQTEKPILSTFQSNNNMGSKKFEGSKVPLPGKTSPPKPESKGPTKHIKSFEPPQPYSKQNVEIEPSTSNVRSKSKIFDMVNKMESQHSQNQSQAKPPLPPEPVTPKRSFKKSFPGPFYNQRQQQHQQQQDNLCADYVDPCDAEFDLNNDQIYDSPPPEDYTGIPEFNGGGSRTSTLNTQCSSVHSETENEPMYDTVAPDQEQEDDYVLLSEEANPSLAPSTSSQTKAGSSGSSANSLTRRGHNNDNENATIKSQTSIMSGQSVATTTSSGTTSDTEALGGSPLPNEHQTAMAKKSSRANYVNIDYFLGKNCRKDSQASGESEEDEPALLRTISIDEEIEGSESKDISLLDAPELFDLDSGVYGSSTDSALNTNSASPMSFRRDKSSSSASETPTMTAAEQEKFAMFRLMVNKITDTETAYVEVLNVMIRYMKALKATLATSKPVLSQDEFNIIFYKIPELYDLHQQFLTGLQQKTLGKSSVGKHFLKLAHDIGVYGAFLQNYSRAVDTVRKCSQNNTDFAEIAKNIRLRTLNNQAVSLETLLYSPVSRIQKNVEIIQDLMKCLPTTHPDHQPLKSALREFQSFLAEFKMIQPEQLFQGQDRNPRHLVKNSFIVELSEGHRKLRHLFLFNDVLVCAKYKASGKSDKFTFELKWYIPVSECSVIEETTEPRESNTVNLVALRSQASTVRDQIKRQTSRDDPKKAKAEKQRKKLAELEAQLVLASPNLVFKVKAGNGRSYTFFLSSEYERSQWVDAIDALKASQPSASSQQLSMHELQNWLTSCRKHLKTNMGSYLLRSGRDENLLVGDLYILVDQLTGIQRSADLYICLEVDSYGHFFRKAKTKMICESTSPCWNQDFTIELEGAQNLRILLYEDHQRQGTLIRAKTTIELNRSWLAGNLTERKIDLQDYVLTISTRFTPSEMTIRRVPTAKPAGLFGAKITQVCKREKRQIPFILTSCLREVERRGINEVGIYRVSGSTSDVSRLKKAFETNSYEAEQLLKDVDIHSVTGSLKLYLRELPEALFTDELYPRFFDAFNTQDQETKKRDLLQLFSTLPPINQHIILSLLDHMVRVNKHENHNKMSLHNIATVFGPTLLRPGAKNEGSGNSDLLAAGTVDVMAQAGILYFFLVRRANGEPMQFTS